MRTVDLYELKTPQHWFRKESVTFLAPDGVANVIASTEPLDPSIDSHTYAMVQGDLLRRDFPEFLEYSFYPCPVMGAADGFRREFTWLTPEQEFVHQIQLYQVDHGRGFTATATARTADGLQQPGVQELLRQIHAGAPTVSGRR